jgi:hypothetical protein
VARRGGLVPREAHLDGVRAHGNGFLEGRLSDELSIDPDLGPRWLRADVKDPPRLEVDPDRRRGGPGPDLERLLLLLVARDLEDGDVAPRPQADSDGSREAAVRLSVDRETSVRVRSR